MRGEERGGEESQRSDDEQQTRRKRAWCLSLPMFFETRRRDAPAVGAVRAVTGGVELEDAARVPGVRVVDQRVVANHPCACTSRWKGGVQNKLRSTEVPKKT